MSFPIPNQLDIGVTCQVLARVVVNARWVRTTSGEEKEGSSKLGVGQCTKKGK